ncbi:MAG: hypothetical protein WBV61_09310 [Rhodanobacteraceae bacterium]
MTRSTTSGFGKWSEVASPEDIFQPYTEALSKVPFKAEPAPHGSITHLDRGAGDDDGQSSETVQRLQHATTMTMTARIAERK